jgi:hypothetical protein
MQHSYTIFGLDFELPFHWQGPLSKIALAPSMRSGCKARKDGSNKNEGVKGNKHNRLHERVEFNLLYESFTNHVPYSFLLFLQSS